MYRNLISESISSNLVGVSKNYHLNPINDNVLVGDVMSLFLIDIKKLNAVGNEMCNVNTPVNKYIAASLNACLSGIHGEEINIFDRNLIYSSESVSSRVRKAWDYVIKLISRIKKYIISLFSKDNRDSIEQALNDKKVVVNQLLLGDTSSIDDPEEKKEKGTLKNPSMLNKGKYNGKNLYYVSDSVNMLIDNRQITPKEIIDLVDTFNLVSEIISSMVDEIDQMYGVEFLMRSIQIELGRGLKLPGNIISKDGVNWEVVPRTRAVAVIVLDDMMEYVDAYQKVIDANGLFDESMWVNVLDKAAAVAAKAEGGVVELSETVVMINKSLLAVPKSLIASATAFSAMRPTKK